MVARIDMPAEKHPGRRVKPPRGNAGRGLCDKWRAEEKSLALELERMGRDYGAMSPAELESDIRKTERRMESALKRAGRGSL